MKTTKGIIHFYNFQTVLQKQCNFSESQVAGIINTKYGR